MPERSKDWFRQAEADLRMARVARDNSHFEWAAFASHQAAEKALKAVFEKQHMEAWGHTLTKLIEELTGKVTASAVVVEAAKKLDKHYIPARYPNGFERGAPLDFYSLDDADVAITSAETILEFCSNLLR